MKDFPMLDGKPIPWEVAQAIYDFMYAPLYGKSQSLERLAERGGFGFGELPIFADGLARREARKPSPS